jgi:hypothetical protein
MNRKYRSFESKSVAMNAPKIKTVSLQIAVTEPDLQKAVWKAFDLAKSAGMGTRPRI